LSREFRLHEGIKWATGVFIKRNGRLWQQLARTWRWTRDHIRTSYRKLTRDSVFFRVEEMGMCSLVTPKLVTTTMKLFGPTTVLDLRCGTGKSLDHFIAIGVDVVGVEGSALAISQAKHPERIQKFNLNRELTLGRLLDLVWRFEFVEHIHPR
jgi:hypothetical protein